MKAGSIRSFGVAQYVRRVDWSGVATWLFGFALVSYLGLKGGGYDPLIHDQVGIAVWWLVLATVLIGVLPRRRSGVLAWIALGLLGAFVAWTALSFIWTESLDRSWADLARVTGYLGVFAMAILIRDAKGVRRMVGAIATAIALVALVGLLSRLHPSWFPEADQTARFLAGGRERLSYPLNYWNGLAALIAIGAPLLLQVATCARSVVLRALAAASLPALALTAFLTLSRGGIAASIFALAVFLAFTSDRLPKLLALLPVAGGSAILIAAADRRDALQHGLLDATAHHQGNELLTIAIVVCVAVGLLQAGLSLVLADERRPRWTRVPSRPAQIATVAALLVALVVAVAVDGPARASDAWGEFKSQSGPDKGAARLGSASGNGRYQLWRAGVDEYRSKPLTGTGSGTFEFWWNRHRTRPETVRDTHSLYVQTLGELGIVGLLVLAAFLLVVLVGGAWATIRAGSRGRPQLAAALAGCAAFFLNAAFDWMWQIPVLPVAMLLLAGALLTAARRDTERGEAGLRWPLRVGAGAVAVAAIVAIAIPLGATSLVRQSEADARSGDLSGALKAAKSAQNVMPGAAAPRLQQALVLEELGAFAPAAEAARAATEREQTNWRNWLALSRIEAERGRVAAAVAAYRKAKSLNPRFSLFE